MTLTIEIRKAGFENKGAAMMLIAATEAIQARFPAARVAIAPDGGSPYPERAPLGLWQRVELIRHGVDLGRCVSLVPPKLRHRYGLVVDSEVDVVLDAAGLAYSDQWGSRPTLDLARRASNWKKAGRTVIMLPQAFGPFESGSTRCAIAKVASHVDLLFARDAVSLAHVEAAAGQRANLRLAPDFTNLLAPRLSSTPLPGARPVALVPNARMLDKTDERVRHAYPIFLARAVSLTRKCGLDPFFLIHEGKADVDLARLINSGLESPVPMWAATDARVAKGIIKGCTAVIGSRYHALISAMSQGVPAIGTGWSHKYAALFADYGCPESLLPIPAPDGALEEAITRIGEPFQREVLAKKLLAPASSIKKRTEAMWDQVADLIEQAHPGCASEDVHQDWDPISSKVLQAGAGYTR